MAGCVDKSLTRSKTGIALLSVLTLALVSACGSGGSPNGGLPSGGASSGPLSAPPPAQISATPPDVPSGSPQCAGGTPDSVNVPSDLQGLIGLCDSRDGTELEIINVSEDVLDVYPAAGNTLLAPVTYDVASSPLPTLADELEVESQNAVVAGLTPPSGAVLLAVGATIMAVTKNAPALVYVGVDRVATAETLAAATWTNYVMGIDSAANPDNYYQPIADCVNSTYTWWKGLQEQPPESVSQMLLDSLQASVACKELQNKVKEYLESQGEQENVSQETQLAGDHTDESDWEQQYSEEEEIQHVIATDTR
jgi:hypothetical protein